MKTAILTAIYPHVEPYLGELVASLATQTDQDFELLVLNDGVANAERFFTTTPFTTTIAPATGTVAEIRRQGLDLTLQRGFEVLLFADADDRFDARRVEVGKVLLQTHGLVFNELMLFGKALPSPIALLKPRFAEGHALGASELSEFNCLGLSNTAIRVELLRDRLYATIPREVVAFDWALFAGLLHAKPGLRAVFTGKTFTEYRQHPENIASPFIRTDEQVVFAANVKAAHYRYMAGISPLYGQKARDFQSLAAKLGADLDFKKWYCGRIKAGLPALPQTPPLWWEPIKYLEHS